jgi:hypothetical protein
MIDLGMIDKNTGQLRKKIPASAGNSKSNISQTKLPAIKKDENKKPLSELQKASFES